MKFGLFSPLCAPRATFCQLCALNLDVVCLWYAAIASAHLCLWSRPPDARFSGFRLELKAHNWHLEQWCHCPLTAHNFFFCLVIKFPFDAINFHIPWRRVAVVLSSSARRCHFDRRKSSTAVRIQLGILLIFATAHCHIRRGTIAVPLNLTKLLMVAISRCLFLHPRNCVGIRP